MKIKLAEALLRRKDLQQKVDTIKIIQDKDIYEVKTQRRAAHEGVDDVIVAVPKLKLKEVTKELDYYSKRLRLIDALIQQANWTVDLVLNDPSIMSDFEEPPSDE